MKTDNIFLLFNYFLSTRQVGHTTSNIKGFFDSPNAIMVCLNNEHIQTMMNYINDKYKVNISRKRFVSIHDLECFRGIKAPLIIDNGTMMEILGTMKAEMNKWNDKEEQYLSEICNKNKEIDDLVFKVNILEKMNAKLKEQIESQSKN